MSKSIVHRRAASGNGNIRKKAVSSKGKQYTTWEGRVTIGHDPGTGKQRQKSVSGKTQKEVLRKMQEIRVQVNNGTYRTPSKETLAGWLDIWSSTYLGGVKPRTVEIYESDIRLHIKPVLGSIKLEALDTHTIQRFYNQLMVGANGAPGLSPKSVKNIHGVLHHALNQAVANGLLRSNPADACILPRVEKKELKPLDEDEISKFLVAIQGSPYEDIFLVTLFTGLREGEVLGLTWDCVDFERGILLINKQIQLHQEKGMKAYALVSPKNGKSRTVAAAPSVIERLKHRRAAQAEQQLLAGPLWDNPDNLVFTDPSGKHLTKPTVYRAFKKAVAAIGRPDARFHDLRHSYAVAALRSGDDVKTVQSNLGHATAAFTLDVYGHVTDKMKQESAARMEKFIQSVSKG